MIGAHVYSQTHSPRVLIFDVLTAMFCMEKYTVYPLNIRFFSISTYIVGLNMCFWLILFSKFLSHLETVS